MATNTFGKLIDNTLLDGPGSEKKIGWLCRDAVELGLRGVCVPGCWALECVQQIKAEAEKVHPELMPQVTAIIGHPFGEMGLTAKMEEIRVAGRVGAKCVEFVPNLGLMLSGLRGTISFLGEISQATRLCREMGMTCRVVLCLQHQSLQQPTMKDFLCRQVRSTGAMQIQPATGWDHSTSSPDDVEFLRRFFGENAIIKASGAFNLAAARKLLNAGANLVSGNGAAIIAQLQAEAKSLRPAARSA